MESTLVSARVARAKKERAGGILVSLGATASDLINSAYDYVIATRQLPLAQDGADAHDARDNQAFACFVEESTLDIDWSRNASDAQDVHGAQDAHDTPADYKALVRGWRRDDYEALA